MTHSPFATGKEGLTSDNQTDQGYGSNDSSQGYGSNDTDQKYGYNQSGQGYGRDTNEGQGDNAATCLHVADLHASVQLNRSVPSLPNLYLGKEHLR